MCRFVLYLGPEMTLDMLTTRPEHSLIHQSFQSRLRDEPLNGDGFGIARDALEEPALFRSLQPAWHNRNLRHIARVCASNTILAHVRAASSGSEVSEVNCHPFTHDRFAFMHNGSISGFASRRRKYLEQLSDSSFAIVRGTTDSEYLFARFLDHFHESSVSDVTERMAEALASTLTHIQTMDTSGNASSFLNLAVSDGTSAVVSRFATGDVESPSLFTLTGSECVCCDGMCRMVEQNERQAAVLVSSEPLNDDVGWQRVAHNHLVLVRPDRSLETRPVSTLRGSVV